VLPPALQVIAWCLPPTYVFEGLRAILIDHVFRADLMLWALSLNAVFICVAAIVFFRLVDSARKRGSILGIGE
jgi:ABC-type polysaccharide/polyol phosphate export permease